MAFASRPDASVGPLFASLLALILLVLSCDARAAAAGAPVEERPLPPLLTPPGAISEPGEGEGAAPDPLVSDAEPATGTQPPAARAGGASFRQPTFATASAPAATKIGRAHV